MFSVMSSATSRRTGDPNRRRASSRSRACNRSSSRSSSTSMSALRVIRNAWCSTMSSPGNNTGRNAAMSASMGRNRTVWWPSSRSSPFSSTNRSTLSGTLIRAKCVVPSSGWRTVIARLRLSPLTNGNGWAGSTASGVSTGNTCSWKYVDSRLCSSSSISDQPTTRMPSSASAGRTSSRKTRACRLASCWVRSPMRRNCSRGDRPSADRTDSPISSRRFSPATRTM